MTFTVVDVDITTMISYYSVRLKNCLTHSVTKDYTTHLNEDRLSFIPITYIEVKEQSNLINPETLQVLLNGKLPIPLLAEFLNLHERLGHMPFVIMYRL